MISELRQNELRKFWEESPEAYGWVDTRFLMTAGSAEEAEMIADYVTKVLGAEEIKG